MEIWVVRPTLIFARFITRFIVKNEQELTIALGTVQFIIQQENKDKTLKIYSKVSVKNLQ